jgi:diaminopimelate epimerase
MLPFIKAHAYGNDFLYVPHDRMPSGAASRVAQRLCDRHHGVGADGLIVYTNTPDGASMTLLNADGSPAELSGNGLRGLAAILLKMREIEGGAPDPEVTIHTTAGIRRLRLDRREGLRYMLTADMGQPEGLTQQVLTAGGETVAVSVMSMGNPQCVVLGALPDDERFTRLGPAIERHPSFPRGTNVEFALVETAERVRIRIWERGVGPTESSGTGSCAAAVAAAAHGGARKRVEVVAPGGAQWVDWTEQGVMLTGWAEIVCEGEYLPDLRTSP